MLREVEMSIATEVVGLKSRVDALKTQRARDEGALEPLMKKLKDEFGCKNLDEARALHAKLKGEQTKKQEALNKTVGDLDEAISAIEAEVDGR
jgi:hypothetical protein